MIKKMSFLLAVVLIVTGLGMSIPAMAQAAPVTLRLPMNPDPEHLNPFTARTIAINTILNNVYEGLVGLNLATGEPEPRLAESWTISPDNLVYTFKLRKGVLFHAVPGVKFEKDDREFKSDDWVWAAKLSLNKDEKISKNPEWLESVVGSKEFKEGTATELKGLEAPDPYTIKLTLSEPNRLLLFSLGVPAVPREAYEQLGADFGSKPVGTGPFMISEWKRDNYLELKANKEYWQKGFPKVDGVRFINIPKPETSLLQYRQGELDFLFGFPTGQRTAVMKEFKAEYNEQPGLNVRYFGFKMNKGFFFDNPKVRQAFNYAFNKELVWNELMEGARFPATQGVLPPMMTASKPATTYKYDPEKAAALLAEAGFPKGQGMPTVKLFVFSSAKDELSFPVLQEDLRKLGVKMEIVVEDATTYWNHIGQEDVEFFLSGWSAGTQDPADVFNYLFLDARDDTKYSNPKVNDLLRAALKEFNAEARVKLYQQAHDLVMADAPWVISAYSKLSWLMKPYITGFKPGGGGTHTAHLWEISIDASKKK